MPASSARIEARLTRQTKDRLQAAADLAGVSLTDFVLQAAERAAQRVFRANGVLPLAPPAQKAFVELLLDPPAATPALKAAVKRYKRAQGRE